ncbi:phage minor structural protein [[Clostridium] sordellii]|uniref:phage tail spike protein n=1 Tax=Paraclostridium sordellii TaxID=1505 RepID=UPI0005DF2D39|nr:phage tail spike protein [Paeniclostridium sordellii]CEP50266.1 phage minor structural protein [[Clostridium] sordellii] [Paeniclostridium sordellii]
MIHLYNKEKKKIAGLIEYKNLSIEKILESGDKTLSFSYPKTSNYYFDIEEECYIRTKEDEFVVKEKNVQRDYTEFKCVLNLENLEGKPFERYESVEQPIDKALALALAGTGWIVGKCSLNKQRTVRMSNCSSLEIIREIKKIYRCDLVFNTLTKTIDVYEHLGEDKGTYFIDSLNLKELSIQGNSYDFFTRIIPIGKDNLRIKDINNGKEYVENYQYSNKVKTVYWKDERYTIVENLKEDAEAKLDEISKPYRAYAAAIINLAKISDDYKDILDYKLGDTITLISKDNKFRDKQRIVKIIEHPDEHELDTIELANTILSFEERQTEFQEAADTVDNITTDNGTIDGSTINSIQTNQISDFEVNVAKITDLTAVNAKITNLEAHNVTITGRLNSVEATIGTLEANVASIDKLIVTHTASINELQANKASITQLQAINATIQVLEANVGKIETLVNGNLSSENIQVGGITGDRLNMKTIFVDDANIVSINASKIYSGEISTNKVKIKSDDGGIEIIGTTLQFKDKNNKVRIQMGKDSKGDFNFIILGDDGTTTLIDHTGIKEKAIANDLIKSNMIASNAVGEKQIDYSSFSEGFNKDTNTHTLNATKIKLNNQNQTLDVAFNQLKTQADENKTTTESNSTTIGVMQGKISTAINNTKIVKDGKTVLLKDDYNRTVATVDSMKSTIGSHTTQINNATGKINGVETKVNSVERNLNSITARVSSTETNIITVTATAKDALNKATTATAKINGLEIGGRNLLKDSRDSLSSTTVSLKLVGSLTIDKNSLSGKTITISLAFDFEGLTPIDGQSNRLGYEMGISFEDGSSFYISCWNYVNSSTKFKGRKFNTQTIPNKPIKSINYSGLYIQCNATRAYIGNPKLEFGNKNTDYTQAPEDFEYEITTTNNKVASLETNLNSITSRVTSVETTTVNLHGQISNLSTRVNTAEQKITDSSIVSTVTKSTTYKNDLNGKVSTSYVVSSINQSAEAIRIDASKIDLQGAVSAGGISQGNYIKIEQENYTTYRNHKRTINIGTIRRFGYYLPCVYLGANGYSDTSTGLDGRYGALFHDGDNLILSHKNNRTGVWSSLKFYPYGDTMISAENTIVLSASAGIQFRDSLTCDVGSTYNIGTKNLPFKNAFMKRLAILDFDTNNEGVVLESWGEQGRRLAVISAGNNDADLCFRTSYEDNRIFMDRWHGHFYPNKAASQDLGLSDRPWKTVFMQNAPSVMSDRRVKENIQYLDSTVISDMYAYVKNDLKLAKFNYIGNSKSTYGFIAQDVEFTKIGKEIVLRSEKGNLSYDMGSRMAVLEGALKLAILKIEGLEQQLDINRSS